MSSASFTAPGSPLPQRELLQRYTWLVLLSAAARGLGFAAVILVARGFGVEIFGELGFAHATVGYALTFAVFGLGIYGVREAVRHPESIGAVTSTVIAIRLVLGAVAFLALALLTLLPAFRPVAGLVLLYALTLFTSAISVFWVAQSQQRTDVLGLAAVATQALYIGQVYLALTLDLGKHAVPIALATSELVVALGLLVWMRRRVAPLARPLAPAACGRILRRTAPLAGSQMLRAVALGSDMVLLGLLVPMDRVGTYGAAYKLFVLGFTLVGLYVTVVLPHLVHHGTVSVRRMAREVGSLLRKLLLLAIPLAALGVAVAPWVMRSLFGEEFADATTPMRLLVLATLASLFGGHYRPAVLAMGEHRRDLANGAVSAGVHVAAKLVLIPFFGLTGAALGTLLGEVSFALASRVSLRRLEADEARRTVRADDLESAGFASGSTTGAGNPDFD